MAATQTRSWQAEILDQLGTEWLEDEASDATHCAIWVTENESAELLGVAESEIAAVVIAEDKSAGRTGGESRVVRLDDLWRWSRARAAGEEEPEIAATTIEPQREMIDDDPDGTVDEDAEEAEAETPPAETKPGEQASAFDASDYDREDLQIPKVDGESIDKIRVKVTGSVLLDRSDPADVAMYNRMKLGAEVELRVAGKVSGVGTGFTTNREGDLDVVVGEKSLKVDTVWVLEPEQLGGAS